MINIQKAIIVVVTIFTLASFEAFNHYALPTDITEYQEIAYQAIVREAEENPHAGGSAPDIYEYQWSDDVRDDISYLRTLKSKSGDVCCVQYYATDGFNVWLGSVFIGTQSNEILGVSSMHIFTSGVIPFMSLQATLHADTMKTEEYGEFFVIKRTGDFVELMLYEHLQ